MNTWGLPLAWSQVQPEHRPDTPHYWPVQDWSSLEDKYNRKNQGFQAITNPSRQV